MFKRVLNAFMVAGLDSKLLYAKSRNQWYCGTNCGGVWEKCSLFQGICCCRYKYNMLSLFVQRPISFPVLFYYSLVGMRVNLGASFVLILSYVSDRRELSLSEHKLENLFFFTCLWSPRRDFNSWVVIR